MPTGPEPAVTTRGAPIERAAACCILATAATAVVFDPFESSMTDTRIGPKNAFFTAPSSRSPTSHVGAADEDGGVVQILRPAREDRAVHEIADRCPS